MPETVEKVFDRIASYAVQVIMPHIHENGSIDIASMFYTKGYGTGRQFTTIRIPTETGKPNETVLETAIRGVREEAAANFNKFEVDVWGMAHATLVPDQMDARMLHAKITVVAEHKSGELRSMGMLDGDDADEYHGPMMWLEARKLLTEEICERKILHSHGASICAFLSRLADRRDMAEVAKTYYPVLGAFPHKRLTPTEWEAVKKYAAL